jgi:hypothetical protein
MFETSGRRLEEILEDIEEYNSYELSKFKSTDRIDFSKMKKNWGKENIPKRFWIDPTKKYKTRFGYNVSNLKVNLTNDINEVTYPIKGIIHKPTNNGKNEKLEYHIWTLDGRSNVNNPISDFNLVEDKPLKDF